MTLSRRTGSVITAVLAAASCVIHSPAAMAAGKSKPDVASWPEITPAERTMTRVEQDPEADVVILMNERHGKILHRADDWVNVLSYHWRAKILSDTGKRLDEVREVTIQGGKYSRITDIQARTVKPDGTVLAVPPDQVFEKTVMLGGQKLSEWVFTFPAVETGAILEYKYDRYDNYLTFVRPFNFEGAGFTLNARVSQAMPEEAGYQILCSRCPPGTQPSVKKWVDGPAKGKIYEIELTNLPGYQYELLMPPQAEVSPRLEMVLHTWHEQYIEALARQDRFFIDWASTARYAEFYYEKGMADGLPALRTLVNGWIEGITDPHEKTKAILRHVRDDFRYIGYEYVVGSTRPVGKLVQDMSADNEEKAVLLRSALQIAGIESHFALVCGRQTGVLNPEFFGFSQFTHAAVVLPKGEGGYEWLDPTIPYAPFGFVSWKDSGAKALLIKKGQGELVNLPVKNELSRTRYEVTVKPREDGQALLAIDAEYSGEDAIDMRSELGPAGIEARRKYLTDWLVEQLPGAVMNSHQIENLEKVDDPLKIKIEASAPGIVTKADDVTLVKGCLLTGFESNPIRRRVRKQQLCVDRGWNTQEAVVIETPAGMQPAQMPAPVSADSAVAKVSFQCNTTLEGNVRCSRVFSAPRKRWPINHFENFRTMMDKVVVADRTSVAFQAKAAAGGS